MASDTVKRVAARVGDTWASDACYFIGASHTVCEDYALAGELDDGRPFAIVADGCSSSAGTDVGARILARIARHSLELNDGQLDMAWVIRRAAACATLLNLGPTALDATLMVATMDGGQAKVLVAGDGAVAARRCDGSVETWELDCDGAPGYPSYALHPARLQAYLDQAGARTVVHRLGGYPLDRSESRLRPPEPHSWSTGDEHFLWSLELDPGRYDSVVLLSDGATSFTDAKGQAVSLQVIAEEVLAVRSGCGAYLLRRVRRFLKGAAKRGFRHHDDLAAAGLLCTSKLANEPV
ncbi:MAG: hypothetical protein E2P02_01580 [Acidobacteria bacterium]|nr:MAG: hypothetical protein E2P02_01580 [Acidobacteriota bacterium]